MGPKALLLLAGFVLLAGAASAAEIYGQLWVTPANSAPVGGVVETSCGGQAEVDRYGRYRITGLPKNQTCALTIQYRNLTSNLANVYTGSHRNGANFMLKFTGERLLLIRR